MPFITLSSGLTIKVPTLGTRNWGPTIFTDTWTKISQHGHTGSPDGLKMVTASYTDLSITGAKIAAGTITADKLAGSITYGQLDLTDSIVNADINSAAAIAYSKLSLNDSIVNADINSAAAIAYSKLSIADGDLTIAKTSGLQTALDAKQSTTLADGKIWIGDVSNAAAAQTMSGDITISNAGVTAIGATKVTNSMLAGSIEDSKLNTITTAGKVSGSAVQLLANEGLRDSTGLAVDYDNSTIGIVSNKLAVKAGGINDNEVNAAAAIAYSKLSLTNSIVTNDIVDNNVTSGKLAKNIALGNAATLTPSGVLLDVNFNFGNNQDIDLGSASGDVTLTFSNTQAGALYTIIITQGATARDITWPGACLWPQGQKPIINLESNKVHKVVLFYNGTNYYGTWEINFA